VRPFVFAEHKMWWFFVRQNREKKNAPPPSVGQGAQKECKKIVTEKPENPMLYRSFSDFSY